MDQNAATATPRGNVQAKHRPHSRGSTASIHSATTQANMDHVRFADAPDMYGGSWMNHPGPSKEMVPGHQISQEDISMLHAAAQMQTSGHDFSMDSSMNASIGHHMAYQQHDGLPRHPLPMEQYSGNASFTEGDTQMMDREDNDDGDSMAAVVGLPKQPTARSSANNELEMRQLFGANRHRSLQQVATELHGNERGPNSERARQVFAMLWIDSVCGKGKGSVPRGRVYANYASRCAAERITVLNPASFGKLVRVLFPGLKTRRLGVRGESKYHYVNFTLLEDQPDAREASMQPPQPIAEAPSQSQSLGAAPTQTSLDLTSGAQELSQHPKPEPSGNLRSSSKSSFSSRSFYIQPDLAMSIEDMEATSSKTSLELSFVKDLDEDFDQTLPVNIPPIGPYLPPGTDPDAAKSLFALYLSHCTSLVECIRFCREKTFFHLYTAFQGTLTMPVQKLFGNPLLAPWIEGCDLILYQRMMTILSGLTMQVLPKQVLDTLRNISERLVPHIRESFHGQPHHVLRAKEAPASRFAALVDRALRVNLTAHAAANQVSNPANRDQMYLDWITMIRPRKIAECVPTRGMDDLVRMLVKEMRYLLDPAQIPAEVETLTVYGTVVARDEEPSQVDGGSDLQGQNVLDRWVALLRSLPERFEYASHAEILWCVERVGTAVMRDLTLAQGKSYGSWWVTKVWIDEMISFLAEQGGFMKQSIPPCRSTEPSPQPTVLEEEVKNSRNKGPEGEELGANDDQSSHPQLGRAPFPPTHQGDQSSAEVAGGDLHDDSGISIRTPEDEFPMEKFAFSASPNVTVGPSSMPVVEAT